MLVLSMSLMCSSWQSWEKLERSTFVANSRLWSNVEKRSRRILRYRQFFYPPSSMSSIKEMRSLYWARRHWKESKNWVSGYTNAEVCAGLPMPWISL